MSIVRFIQPVNRITFGSMRKIDPTHNRILWNYGIVNHQRNRFDNKKIFIIGLQVSRWICAPYFFIFDLNGIATSMVVDLLSASLFNVSGFLRTEYDFTELSC